MRTTTKTWIVSVMSLMANYRSMKSSVKCQILAQKTRSKWKLSMKQPSRYRRKIEIKMLMMRKRRKAKRVHS